MFPSTVVRHDVRADTFPNLLRTWRQKRRLSQFDLALTSRVSQRHISFLESGCARPSRETILKISETLEVPLRERNVWLVAAGFAPVFKARPLDDPQMSQVMSAVRMMLTNHEPFPAVAVDRVWNIRLANPPFERLTAMLGADIWKSIGGAQREAQASAGEDMRQILAELCPYPLAVVGVLIRPADFARKPPGQRTVRQADQHRPLLHPGHDAWRIRCLCEQGKSK